MSFVTVTMVLSPVCELIVVLDNFTLVERYFELMTEVTELSDDLLIFTNDVKTCETDIKEFVAVTIEFFRVEDTLEDLTMPQTVSTAFSNSSIVEVENFDSTALSTGDFWPV